MPVPITLTGKPVDPNGPAPLLTLTANQHRFFSLGAELVAGVLRQASPHDDTPLALHPMEVAEEGGKIIMGFVGGGGK